MWRRWGIYTSESPFGIIDELWKTKKSQFWENEKKIAGDIIILHMCTKNQSYKVQFLRYGVRQIFLSFWAIFCPLPPSPKNPENQNFEQMNKASGDVIILTCATKNTIKWYMLSYSNMECNRHNFLSFKAIFCSFTLLLT